MCDDHDKCDQCHTTLRTGDARCIEDNHLFCSLDCYIEYERNHRADHTDRTYERWSQARMNDE